MKKILAIITLILLIPIFTYAGVFSTGRKSLVFGPMDTTKTAIIRQVGETGYIEIVMPAFDTTVTGTFELINSNGVSSYTCSTSLAESTTYVIEKTKFITSPTTIKMTLSDTAGASGGTVTVDIFMNN
jgi:hypothetical protein